MVTATKTLERLARRASGTHRPRNTDENPPSPTVAETTVTEAAPRPVRRAGASSEQYNGLGRRKTSVARVTLQPGARP